MKSYSSGKKVRLAFKGNKVIEAKPMVNSASMLASAIGKARKAKMKV